MDDEATQAGDNRRNAARTASKTAGVRCRPTVPLGAAGSRVAHPRGGPREAESPGPSVRAAGTWASARWPFAELSFTSGSLFHLKKEEVPPLAVTWVTLEDTSLSQGARSWWPLLGVVRAKGSDGRAPWTVSAPDTCCQGVS